MGARYVIHVIDNKEEGGLVGKDVCSDARPYEWRGTVTSQTCGFIFMCCRKFVITDKEGKTSQSDVEGEYFIDDKEGKEALQTALASGSKKQVEDAITKLKY